MIVSAYVVAVKLSLLFCRTDVKCTVGSPAQGLSRPPGVVSAVVPVVFLDRLLPNQKIQQELALVWTMYSVKCSTSVGMSAVLAHRISRMCLLLCAY